MKPRDLLAAASLFVAASATFAQNPAPTPSTPLAASAPTAVPALVPYTGIAQDSADRPLSGEMLVTFSLYKEEQGGEPLWTESQSIVADTAGHYKAQLGATSSTGLPLTTFASGEGRWLEVQIAGQKQQPRILLMSVPYAMKAADAETLGGLPASAYALAGSTAATNALTATAVAPNVDGVVTTPGGKSGFLPVFAGGSVIGNSVLSETGNSIGIGITTPLATLDVNGTLAVRGELGLTAMGYATSSKPYLSHPFDFITSVYNSGTKTPNYPEFQFQAEPIGNNTSSPSASLNLLYTNGATPAETGLSISPKGILKFAPGQTFPGVGAGTITGVTAGTDLLGGGTTGNVTLSIDTTKVAQLMGANLFNGPNTFVQTQTIGYGDLALSGTEKSGTGAITIGGLPYLSGFGAHGNVFVGNAGNFITTGGSTTGTGNFALASQTSGSQNTAVGSYALGLDTSGGSNTAVGYNAGMPAGTFSNTTAVGANATVSQNNSLVLGNTAAGKPGTEFVNVGIGTDTPSTVLEASVSAPSALGPTLTLANPGGGNGAAASINFNTDPQGPAAVYGPSSQILAVSDGENGDTLSFLSYYNAPSYPYEPRHETNMVINADSQVGIPYASPTLGTETPGAQLTVTGTSAGTTPDGGPQQIGLGLSGISSSGGTSLNRPGGDGGDFSGGPSRFFIAGSGSEGGTFVGGDVTTNGPAVPGAVTVSGDGIYASAGGGSGNGFTVGNAATLDGNVDVTGTLTAATKDFKIDSPSDPANKYLYHASVESSEMMDIYSGNVVTDELGVATVTLPSWFQTLNTDFRYQLTTIGRDAHAWVSQEVANGKFIISTNATGVKVSWQITAVRQDAYAKAHPLVVEQAKPASERGYYMHPELYGQPQEKQTEWGRHPEQMRRIQTQRAAQLLPTAPAVGPRVNTPASAVARTFPQHAAPGIKTVSTTPTPASPVH